jgi:hypothetical protein
MTVPIVPIELQDRYFRGLQINKGYIKGEWDANFTKTTVTIIQPSGSKMTGQVSSEGPYIVITWPDGKKISSQWQLQSGQVVDYLAWAWGAPNGPAPTSYNQAMTSPGMTSYEMVACPKNRPSANCKFTS